MSVRRDFSQHMEGRNDFGAETLANRGVWEYMVNGVSQGEYLISESEDKCAFIGTSDNGDTVHIGIGVKQSRTKYEFLSTVLSNPHSPPVVSLIVAERLGSELIQMSRKGQSGDTEEEAKDIRWVPSGYQYTLSLVTRLYSTVATVLKNHQHYGELSGVWEWRDLESSGDSVVVPVYYMLVHIPNSSIFTSPFAKATEHIVDLVLEVVVNVSDGWSEVGVAKFYRSGEGRKKGILRGRADMIRCSMSEQGNASKNLRFRPRVLYVDGSEIKDLEERRVWLKTSGNVNTQPSDGPPTLHDPKDPESIPVVSPDQHLPIKAILEKLVPSFFTMIKACDTSRARKLLLEMEPDVRKAFLNSAGPDLTEFAFFTPLMLASRWSLPELSKFLVAQGADVRGTVEFEGRQTNALHHAILCAHQGVNAGWELVKYLVEKCRMEVDLLALEWASPHLRQKKDTKPKFPEEVAYLWTKVAPRARKELKEAIAASYMRLNQEVTPALRIAPEVTPKPTPVRPQAEPKAESKAASSNWRNVQNVQAPAVAVVARPEPVVVRAPFQPQFPAPQESPAVEPKRYVPPALRNAKPDSAFKSKGSAKLGGALKGHKFPVKVAGKPVVNDRNKRRANPLAPTVKFDASSDRSNWGIRLISSH